MKILLLSLLFTFFPKALSQITSNRSGLIDAALIYIKPQDMAYILQTHAELKEKDLTNSTFFETFPRFLLSFDGEDNNEIGMDYMASILGLVLKHNLDNGTSSRAYPKLEIWVSIKPNKNVEETVAAVCTVINSINSKNSGTVSTLLLNYGSLQLDREAIHLLKEDIQIVKSAISSSLDQNLRMGIILERHNCAGKSELIYSLNLSDKDKVVFLSQFKNDEEVISNMHLTEECLRENASRLISSAEVNIRIDISIKTNTFRFEPNQFYFLEDWYFNYIEDTACLFVFKAKIINETSQQSNDGSIKKLADEEQWLRQPINFNKNHIGVSIYTSDQVNLQLPQLTPLLFGTFRKVLVKSRYANVFNESHLEFLVDSAEKYKTAQHSQDLDVGKSKNFEDEVPLQMSVVLNAWLGAADGKEELFLNYTILLMKSVWLTVTNVNRKHTGIVTNILLNWIAFAPNETITEAKEMMTNFEQAYITTPNLEKQLAGFFDLFDLTTRIKQNYDKGDGSSPKIGIIWETKYCTDLYAHASDVPLKPLFHLIETMLLKITISKEYLLEKGAEATCLTIVDELNNCDYTIYDISVEHSNPKPNVQFYVKLTGCTSGHAELRELREVIRFWELMNSWAAKENHTLYIDTAFEHQEKSSSSGENLQCSKLAGPYLPQKECDCGWWNVVGNPSTSPSVNNFSFEDKKSLALRLHEKMHRPPPVVKPSGNEYRYGLILKIAVSTSIIVFLVIITASCMVHHYRSKYILSKNEMRNFVRGSLATKNLPHNSLTLDGSGQAESQPYNKRKYELTKSSFQIDFKRRLGSGEFGTVCYGTVKRGNARVGVAVKMINKLTVDNEHGHYLSLKGLISEIKILSFVGEHQHIIKLEGAYTVNLRRGKVFVFLELCELGSLDKYLRAYKPDEGLPSANRVSNVDPKAIEMETITNGPLSNEMSQNLFRWSAEIASAMQFIASKKIVHADLSTRNILLDAEKTAKVSDFGLSRRLYDYTEYLKTERGPLPWRTMAPESLHRMIFNEKTDVWAYGVTLWEMFTLGDEPYPGLAWNVNFPTLVERGLRLSEPKYNLKNVYSVMRQCWESAPCRRPRFFDLHEIFIKISVEDASF